MFRLCSNNSSGGFATDAIFYGLGTGVIVLDNLDCTGNESKLVDCPANDPFLHNCDHSEDAGLICNYTASPGSQLNVQTQSV